MLSITSDNLRSLAQKCNEIGDELADREGFVPVRHLAARFDADLQLRPLLVEAMLASIEPGVLQSSNGGSDRRWAVLLDSETYSRVTESDIQSENASSPLPARLRNTIAHELVHSFAFRANEFGVELTRRKDSQQSKRDFVKAIEQETEKLSPLLLVSYKYLDAQLARERESLSIQDLQTIAQRMSVSRYVLINRLNLLRLTDKKNLLSRPALSNLAVGIGEWLPDGEARLKEWPLFLNFIADHKENIRENIVPEFLIKLSMRHPISLTEVFSDTSFCLRGGDTFITEAIIRGGTRQAPAAKTMKILCSVEPNLRKAGTEFFFLVRSVKNSSQK